MVSAECITLTVIAVGKSIFVIINFTNFTLLIYKTCLKKIVIIGLCFAFQSCALFTKVNPPGIKGIKIIQIVPKFREDGSVSKYDTLLIFRYSLNNKIVYDFPSVSEIYTNNTLDSSALTHVYVVYSKGDTTGTEFTYRPGENVKPVVLDSVFSYLPKIELNALTSDNNNVILLKKIEDPYSGLFTEEYYLNNKSDTSISSIMSLSYSDKVRIPDYSFSEQFDSTKQMKLVEIKVNTFPRYYPAFNRTQPGYSLVLKIEEIEPENNEKLVYYFKKATGKKRN